MSRTSSSRLLVAVLALFHFTLGCGDDDKPSSKPPSTAGVGAAGESGAGGEAGSNAGAGAGNAGAAGEAGGAVCDPNAVVATPPANAHRARSAGYQGADDAYLALFDVPCTAPTDCTSSCTTAGGDAAMCAASECLPSAQNGNSCVPAPVWDNLGTIQTEDASVTDMCQLILVSTAYRDALLTDQFRLQVPDDATILGLTVEVRRVGDATISDDSVRIIKTGKIGAAEHALPQPWSTDVGWVSYGGPTDLWGETWTSADLNSDEFGLALSAAYSQNVGNTVAYVDEVRVTVSYQRACD